MKFRFLLVPLLTLLIMNLRPVSLSGQSTAEEMIKKITWISSACFHIEAAGKNVYFDPYQTKNEMNKADLVLINDNVFPRYHAGDIYLVTNSNTVVIAPDTVASSLKIIYPKTVGMKPGMKTNISSITVEAVPANNPDSPERNIGYVITMDGVRIFHAGNSSQFPEMKKIQCDILIANLYPSEEEPLELGRMAVDTKALFVIPMQYYPSKLSRKDADQIQEFLGKRSKIVTLPMLSE